MYVFMYTYIYLLHEMICTSYVLEVYLLTDELDSLQPLVDLLF